MTLLLKAKESTQTGPPVSLVADSEGKLLVADSVLSQAIVRPARLVAPVNMNNKTSDSLDVTGSSGVRVTPLFGTAGHDTYILWVAISPDAAVGGETLTLFKPVTGAKNDTERWLPVDPDADHQYLHMLITDGTHAPAAGGASDDVAVGLEVPPT